MCDMVCSAYVCVVGCRWRKGVRVEGSAPGVRAQNGRGSSRSAVITSGRRDAISIVVTALRKPSGKRWCCSGDHIFHRTPYATLPGVRRRARQPMVDAGERAEDARRSSAGSAKAGRAAAQAAEVTHGGLGAQVWLGTPRIPADEFSVAPPRQRRCLRRRADVCTAELPSSWFPPPTQSWPDRPPRVARPLGPVSQTSIHSRRRRKRGHSVFSTVGSTVKLGQWQTSALSRSWSRPRPPPRAGGMF
jgi:hypothetical protein